MSIHLLIYFSLIKWIHARLVSVMVSIPVILQTTSKNFPLHLDLCHRLPLLPPQKGMGAPWRRRSTAFLRMRGHVSFYSGMSFYVSKMP